MATNAERAAAEQAAADKRAADEAASAAAAANWPTGGYIMFTLLLLISMCIVLWFSVDGSTIWIVLYAYTIKYQYVHIMIMIYSSISLIRKLPRYSTKANILFSWIFHSQSTFGFGSTNYFPFH